MTGEREIRPLIDSYAQRGVNPTRLRVIEQHDAASVLDVGCGNGAYVRELHDSRFIVGADASHFAHWSELPSRFVQSTATRLPFRESSFDMVTAFEALEHLEEPMDALHEFHRVTRRMLLLTVPNCEITSGMRTSGLTYHHYVDPTHVNFYDLDSICAQVESASFSIVEKLLVNEINIFPLIGEAFRLPSVVTRLGTRAVRRLQKRYGMTCLVVAQRTR